MAGIYVHIPFCASRCIYCGFYSSTLLSLRERYIKAVGEEYSMRREYLRDETVKTLYAGGGTPSVLEAKELDSLFTTLLRDNSDVEEITMECNPDDVTEDFARHISRLGVNRVSMGVQTFSDLRLRFLRRRHTSEDVCRAVDALRKAGIGNISIDLIFGFPGQTLREWHSDIYKATALNTEHISAYSLAYEPGTPLFAMLKRGDIKETDEETSREMYYSLIDKLADKGYEQYEISNFCRKGYRSKHNGNYWKDVPYLGLGAAAHSYDRNSRQWNINDVEQYINAIERSYSSGSNIYAPVPLNEISRNGCCALPFERECLSPDEHYNDMITTALRTVEGIDLSVPFHNKDYLLRTIQPFLRQGLLTVDRRHLRLTRPALFISDFILAELMKV